jgi:hypothetical protein
MYTYPRRSDCALIWRANHEFSFDELIDIDPAPGADFRRTDIRTDMRTDIRTDMRTDIRTDIRTDMRTDIRTDGRADKPDNFCDGSELAVQFAVPRGVMQKAGRAAHR